MLKDTGDGGAAAAGSAVYSGRRAQQIIQFIRRSLGKLMRVPNNPFLYGITYRFLIPEDIAMLNWGYAPIDPSVASYYVLPGQPHQHQLYLETFRQLQDDLNTDQVLCEVSCGRGGGLAFLSKLSAGQFVGLERDAHARKYASKNFGLDIRKTVGPLINMPDVSVDVFLSVEAMHSYIGDTFFQELHRCLKPEGQLVVSDMISRSEEDAHSYLKSSLEKNGFRLDRWSNITRNIISSLENDTARQEKILHKYPAGFRNKVKTELAMVGSADYNSLVKGIYNYIQFKAIKI